MHGALLKNEQDVMLFEHHLHGCQGATAGRFGSDLILRTSKLAQKIAPAPSTNE
jgi:hypothetical protein